MKRTSVWSMLFIVSATLLSGQDRPQKTIASGVEVILSPIRPCPKEGEPSILHLEKELSIDVKRGDVAKAGLKDIWQFDIDSQGNIYIAGSYPDGKSILKFDARGNLVGTVGREGADNDEFKQLGVIRLNRKDEIVVADAAIDAGKALFLTATGAFIRAIPMASIKDIKTGLPNEPIRGTQILDVCPLENGFYLTQWTLNYQTELDHYNPLILCDSKGRQLKELDSHKVPGMHLAKFERIKGIFPRFSWSVSRDRIYVANDERDYEIQVFDLRGRLTRKIRKVYQPVPIGETYRETILSIFGNAPWKQKIYFPENFPAFQYAFSDDEGHLFVMTYEVGQDSMGHVYDIFNSDGIFIGRTRLSNHGIPDYWDIGTAGPLEVRAKRNHLYCNQMTADGHNQLVVYKMTWRH